LKRVVLRADGSSTIGMGHLMRCMALAQMLDKDLVLGFATYKPDQAVRQMMADAQLDIVELDAQLDTGYAADYDAVVLDGYWFDNKYVQALKVVKKKVIQIDDFAGPEFFADLVINHALNVDYSHSVFHGGRLLAGSRYALLRQEFLNPPSGPQRTEMKTLLLSMGGADPANYTLKLLEAIKQTPRQWSAIRVIIGSAYSHGETLSAFARSRPDLKIEVQSALDASDMAALMAEASLFVCSASTVAYEAMAVKVPMACFMTAENQKGIYEGLLAARAILGLGDISRQNGQELKRSMEKAFSDFNLALSYLSQQEQLIDGCSGKRIKEEVLSLWN
jgi:UDP-2,4-diacetamido-2,4,6-trideoxy-beta-L-altropyranose hydrolase